MKRDSLYEDGQLVALAIEDGSVEIYQYPVLSDEAQPVRIAAHFGPLGGISFSSCGGFLITAGIDDNCVKVWSLYGRLKG